MCLSFVVSCFGFCVVVPGYSWKLKLGKHLGIHLGFDFRRWFGSWSAWSAWSVQNRTRGVVSLGEAAGVGASALWSLEIGTLRCVFHLMCCPGGVIRGDHCVGSSHGACKLSISMEGVPHQPHGGCGAARLCGEWYGSAGAAQMPFPGRPAASFEAGMGQWRVALGSSAPKVRAPQITFAPGIVSASSIFSIYSICSFCSLCDPRTL